MELLWSILGWLYLFVFLFILTSATVHHFVGLRKLYLEALMKLFAFGQKRYERKILRRRPRSISEDSEIIDEETNKPIFIPNEPKVLGIEEDIMEDFQLDHMMDYISAGMSAIQNDTLIPCFEPEELSEWNLLSRTNKKEYEFVSFRLTACWVFGFFIRYFIIFPMRIIVLITGVVLLFVCMSIIGIVPESRFKRWLYCKLSVFCMDFLMGSLTLIATFHDVENAPKGGGIAVANHTSPIDALVLASHQCYDMVGQKHDGALGIIANSLSKASSHIWFERSQAKERTFVKDSLQHHVNNPELPPILIFPEGVCVNNTSVLQFKKGAFEIDTEIYPVAIRFDARFGDAFWWQDDFLWYMIHMMTSWAIVCNVWYLPPMKKSKDETAIAFANRVKAKIAHQGGLIDLSWDGFLKMKPIKEEWRKEQQKIFAKHINTGSNNTLNKLSNSDDENNVCKDSDSEHIENIAENHSENVYSDESTKLISQDIVSDPLKIKEE